MPSNKDSKKDKMSSKPSSSSKKDSKDKKSGSSSSSRPSAATLAPQATRLTRDEAARAAASSSSKPSSASRPNPSSRNSSSSAQYVTQLVRDEVAQTAAPVASSPKPSSSSRPSTYARDSSSSARDRPLAAAKSTAPPRVKSIYLNPKDAERAAKQTMYNTMNAKEKKEQDKWLQKNVFDKSTPCPKGFTWERVPGHRSDGYVCNGGNHLVTDDMIAHGLGGVWLLPYGRRATEIRVGPYYQDKAGAAWCWAGYNDDMIRLCMFGVQTALVILPEGEEDMCYDEQQRLFDEFRLENGLEPVDSVPGLDQGFN